MLRLGQILILFLSLTLPTNCEPLNVDLAYHPQIPAPTTLSAALPLEDGRVLVAGNFHRLNGEYRPGWAKLDVSGALDATFVPDVHFSELFSRIETLLPLPNGSIMTGQWSVRRFDRTGKLDRNFELQLHYSQPGIAVRSIVPLPDGMFLVGGLFEWAGPELWSSRGLARFFGNGEVDESFARDLRPYDVRDIVRQPDGKLVVAVTGGVYRLLPDGQIDPAFEPFTSSYHDARTVKIDPSGRILVAGYLPDASRTNGFALTRLLPDGTVDPSFVRSLAGPNGQLRGERIELLSDGNILVTGLHSRTPDGVGRIVFISQLLPDGEKDPAFRESFPVSTRSANDFFALKSLPDGKIVFALARSNLIWRLNSDGSLDFEFPCNPQTIPSLRAVGLESSGSLLLRSWNNSLQRLLPSQQLDPPFLLQPGLNPGEQFGLEHAVLAPNGSIIASGGISSSSRPGPTVVRFLPDGTRDTSFWMGTLPASMLSVVLQTDGKVVYFNSNSIGRLTSGGLKDFNFSTWLPTGVQISSVLSTPDRKLLVAGTLGQTNVLFRLLEHGQKDESFQAEFAGPTFVLDPEGRIIVVQSTAWQTVRAHNTPFPPPNELIVRLLPNGAVDPSFQPRFDPYKGPSLVYSVLIQRDGGVLIGGRGAILTLENTGQAREELFLVSGDVNQLLAAPEGRVYLTGNFAAVNGITRLAVARLRPASVLHSSRLDPIGYFRASTSPVLPNSRIQTSTDLSDWTTLGCVDCELIYPPDSEQRFFRIISE